MYTLFQFDLNIQTAHYHDPDWVYVSDTLARGLREYIAYYHKNTFAVKSNHLLVKLLQSIAVNKNTNIYQYYNAVDDRAGAISMGLKLTSSFNKGHVFNNVFFGERSSEIILSYSAPFDLQEESLHWQSICAVNILRHDRSSLHLNALDGREKYAKDEVAVLSINIPLLALQYKCFRDHENIVGIEESEKSAMQFIAQYVLPNMQKDYLDHALFNRFYNRVAKRENDVFIQNPPFYQTDYSNKVDAIIDRLVARFENNKLRLDAVLRSVPMVSYKNLLTLMELPPVLPAIQITWALVASRIKALDFLFTLSDISNSTDNQSSMNRIARQAIFYRSDNTLKYGLPSNLYLDIQETIDRLEAIALKK